MAEWFCRLGATKYAGKCLGSFTYRVYSLPPPALLPNTTHVLRDFLAAAAAFSSRGRLGVSHAPILQPFCLRRQPAPDLGAQISVGRDPGAETGGGAGVPQY